MDFTSYADEKLSMLAQAAIRAELYESVEKLMEEEGLETEPFKSGLLVHLGNSHFAKISIAIANEKFSLDDARATYAQILAKRAQRAEIAKARAIEREEKARQKAERAAEKAQEED